MIQLIEYNKPTISGRIYQQGSVINIEKIKDFFIIEKPNINEINITSLKDAIFISKIEENEFGIYMKDLEFIKTDDNKLIMELFENKIIGISLVCYGEVNLNDIVENAEIIKAVLNPNHKETNASHDFTYEFGEAKLILEFVPYDRYGTKYVINEF